MSGWMLGIRNREHWRKSADTIINIGVSRGGGRNFELLADMLVFIKLCDSVVFVLQNIYMKVNIPNLIICHKSRAILN